MPSANGRNLDEATKRRVRGLIPGHSTVQRVGDAIADARRRANQGPVPTPAHRQTGVNALRDRLPETSRRAADQPNENARDDMGRRVVREPERPNQARPRRQR